jgi:hypothetical protein
VAAVPVVRASGTLQSAGVRVATVAVVALIAALVLGWSFLVPGAIALAGGLYAAQLAIDDTALDVSAPVIAAGLVLTAELAHWSLEERDRVPGDPGDGLRHGAFVALLVIAALLAGAALLALVDAVRAESLTLDLLGAAAAAATLVGIALAAGIRGRSGQSGTRRE